MSGDEQDAAIVRLVKDRGEAKRRRALLESELRAAGQSLWEIGGSLRSVKAGGSHQESPAYILPYVDKAPEICRLDRVKAMLEELRDLEGRISQLNRSAAELGID